VCVADPVAGHGGFSAKSDEQVGLAGTGAGVADQAERQAFPVPQSQVAGVWMTAGSMCALASKSKPRRDFFPQEGVGFDALFGAPVGLVVALGHEQFGQTLADDRHRYLDEQRYCAGELHACCSVLFSDPVE
jgi:hypothetical protein